LLATFVFDPEFLAQQSARIIRYPPQPSLIGETSFALHRCLGATLDRFALGCAGRTILKGLLHALTLRGIGRTLRLCAGSTIR
jgi:hypothetical protein